MELMNHSKRTKKVERVISEIRDRMSEYEIKEGHHTPETRRKFRSIIAEICDKYNQKESTVRMILKHSYE